MILASSQWDIMFYKSWKGKPHLNDDTVMVDLDSGGEPPGDR